MAMFEIYHEGEYKMINTSLITGIKPGLNGRGTAISYRDRSYWSNRRGAIFVEHSYETIKGRIEKAQGSA